MVYVDLVPATYTTKKHINYDVNFVGIMSVYCNFDKIMTKGLLKHVYRKNMFRRNFIRIFDDILTDYDCYFSYEISKKKHWKWGVDNTSDTVPTQMTRQNVDGWNFWRHLAIRIFRQNVVVENCRPIPVHRNLHIILIFNFLYIYILIKKID